MVTMVGILSPLANSKVYAIPTTCNSGIFVGRAENLDAIDIMKDPNYTGKVSIVGFDVANCSDNNSDDNHKNHNETAIGNGPTPKWHNSNYTSDFLNVAQQGKDTMISATLPNPVPSQEIGSVGQIAYGSQISDADFKELASVDIKNINQSSPYFVRNYGQMVSKLGDIIEKYHTELMDSNGNATIYLRPFHEMNSPWLWWGFKNQDDFKNLWIHLHNYLVNDRKFTWLKFCFAASAGDPSLDPAHVKGANSYYPGNNYVDTVALDGYSDDPSNDSGIKKQYAELTATGKPFGFAELGAKVDGDFVNVPNERTQQNVETRPFNYQKWSDAIQKYYSNAKYCIVFGGAYDPRNNLHGTSLFSNSQEPNTSINYQAHVQNIGWQDSVQDGDAAGTIEKALRMEAIKINYPNNAGLHVEYSAQVQNKGWMPAVRDGAIAGTVQEGLRMEAIKISLKDSLGNVSNDYSVYYRAQVQNKGWMPWVKNGAIAGTVQEGLRMEAIEIYVVKNNTPVANFMDNKVANAQ